MTDWLMPRGVRRVPLPDAAQPTPKASEKGSPSRQNRSGRVKTTKSGKSAISTPEVFLAALKARGLPQPHREVQFAPPRLFRADYCFMGFNLLVEVEGGVYTRQAHGSISGILRDIEKYNLAAAHGFRVLRVVPKDLCSEEFLNVLQQALNWHPK